MRIKGTLPRQLPAAVMAALMGLAPLAASSAAPADAGASGVEAATSAAVIEMDPVEIPADITAPAQPVTTPLGRGSASYYASKFNGRRTASGERFDNSAMTAAHRTLPFGTMVRVTNPANGASVVVRINDRGPFTRGRAIDVSRAAAEQLGLIAPGHAVVELDLIEG